MPRRMVQCPDCLHVQAELRGGVLRQVVRFAVVVLVGTTVVLFVTGNAGAPFLAIIRLWKVWLALIVLAIILPGPRVHCGNCAALKAAEANKPQDGSPDPPQ